ncbi:alpha/beta hydrolase family protein [Oceaniglobus roseus]|uniref:alpha/beta hydrolase family protein n=1 Tax=Oceaniglobus roseus TaxID=1737570 RepID=UPI001C12B026|nr:CocE/NonD family hydrolase [Kandeliimicrobium roseum]
MLGTPACRFAEVRETGRAGDLRHLDFTTGDGATVPGLYLPGRGEGHPAVLYCHAHGNRYDIGMREIYEGRPALLSPWLGPLQAAGYAVLCLEMPCFGARAVPGEQALAKALLWRGRTLFGQMLAEQAAGLCWLAAQPGLDGGRIAAMGISMGGTLAWWLAALEERVAAAASMCCFADLATLVESGAHDGHGIYMTVPGLLAETSTGRLSGLAAPRPLLHCVGLADWSTPPDAFARARGELLAVYDAIDARRHLAFHAEEDLGHAESPAMRDRVLAFLAAALA